MLGSIYNQYNNIIVTIITIIYNFLVEYNKPLKICLGISKSDAVFSLLLLKDNVSDCLAQNCKLQNHSNFAVKY